MSLKPMGDIYANGNQNAYTESVVEPELKKNVLAKITLYLVNNQIEFPLTIITIITTCWAIEVPGFEKFVTLQHRDLKTGLYVKGTDDLYFIFLWVTIFTLLRASTMEYILKPLAGCWKIKSKYQVIRFAEQGWSFLYYSVFWTLGMYIMYHSPYWFNTPQFWIGYPHNKMTYLFKWYYLVQLAFWVQQAKGFRGNDSASCDYHFVDELFIFIQFDPDWECCSMLYGFLGYFTAEHKWSPEEEAYFSKNVLWFFMGLLLFLQAIIIFWFVLICQVAWRVIRGDNAHDNRSDSEDDEEALNIHGKANGKVLSHKSKKTN
ncbi:8043_t:CDS:2 [Ambispora gerdemannii]|uniref:8043_t:CDS:1 n=1 Tax=Ambispora gerdemannii TaxID=144530 RepID=A0A9N8YUJ1_9GLOM|nr:8043_t:CDS:2 [Ambispora gerdemannii]